MSYMMGVPRGEDGQLILSYGSREHPHKCVPCIWTSRPKGCLDGILCECCHDYHDLSYAARKRLQSRKAAMKVPTPTPAKAERAPQPTPATTCPEPARLAGKGKSPIPPVNAWAPDAKPKHGPGKNAGSDRRPWKAGPSGQGHGGLALGRPMVPTSSGSSYSSGADQQQGHWSDVRNLQPGQRFFGGPAGRGPPWVREHAPPQLQHPGGRALGKGSERAPTNEMMQPQASQASPSIVSFLHALALQQAAAEEALRAQLNPQPPLQSLEEMQRQRLLAQLCSQQQDLRIPHPEVGGGLNFDATSLLAMGFTPQDLQSLRTASLAEYGFDPADPPVAPPMPRLLARQGFKLQQL